MENKYEALKKIRDEIINLEESPLYHYRIGNKYYPVIGQGNHDASIMFIGEAPGKNEAKQGRPFCGAAGKVLDELLASINIPREEVYITNILKDRPPGNRNPLPEEIKIYAPFLDKQIEIIEPKIIATLGRYAMEYVMRKFGLESKLDKISKIHGEVFESNPLLGDKMTIMPLYHPAVAVYDRSKLEDLKKDFAILKKKLEEINKIPF